MSRRAAGPAPRGLRRAGTPALLAALLLAGAGVAPAPARADEVAATPGDRVFELSGLGYGHGHGLSQHGAHGAATQGVGSPAILDFYYPGTVTARTNRTTIKVRVTDDGTDVRLLPDAGLAVTDTASGRSAVLPTDLGAVQWRAVRSGAGLALQYTAGGSTWVPWSLPGAATLTGPVSFAGPEFVRLVRPGDTRGYRGAVQAAVTGSTLATVNVLGLDDYLRGVVPRESPSSWPAAALQAQAVAARSYAVHAVEHRPAGQYHDTCDTTACQVYGGARLYSGSGWTAQEVASTDQAIAVTSLQVRTYGGATIFAQFSAANGGWTAAGSRPYLAARQDPWDGVTGSSAHAWTASLPAAALEKAYPAVGRLTGIQVTGRDGNGEWGGRVTTVRLTGEAGAVSITGAQFRSATGIRSTWFTVTNAADSLAGRYASDAGLRAQLGAPVGTEQSTAGVRWQQYERGYMYWTAATGAHVVSGQIWGVYLAVGGPGVLGAPVTDELGTPDGVGRFNHFSSGASIYWTPATQAQLVQGQIRILWERTGWETGPLGYPTSGEQAGGGGRYTTFQRGTVFWTPAGGAVEVHGPVAERWAQLGGLSWAVPTSSQLSAGAGTVYNTFSRDTSVYWSQATGAWSVSGQIRGRWLALGGPGGALGLPVSDEQGHAGGVRSSTFQHGIVHWTAAGGPHVLQGTIAKRWTALGGLGWGYGVPVSDELRTPDGVGRFNLFAGNAAIYWTPATKAHAVQGQIRDLWGSLGWETGPLGYPATDEQATADGRGRVSTFQGGAVFWTPSGGPVAVYGAIHARYAALGGVTSTLGHPTGSEYAVPGGRASDFEHGRITWTASTGSTVVTKR